MSDILHYGNFSVSAFDELLRTHRHLQSAIDGPFGLPQALEQLRLRSEALDQVRVHDQLGAFGRAQDELHRLSDIQNSLSDFITRPWVQSAFETALNISRQHQTHAEEISKLSLALDQRLFATSQFIWERHLLLGARLSASCWQESLSALTDQIGPQLGHFRTLAEQWAIFEISTLRAGSDNLGDVSARTLYEQTMEAQQLLEAIAEAPSPEIGAKLVAEFLAMLATIWANTKAELRKLGLITLVPLVITLVDWWPDDTFSDFTEQQRQENAEVRAQLQSLTEGIAALHEAEDNRDKEYLEGLERSALDQDTDILLEPKENAPVVLPGQEGMLYAIIERDGDWTHIVVRDILTDQLVQGWIFSEVTPPDK